MPLCCPDNSEMLSGCGRNQCPDVAEIRTLQKWEKISDAKWEFILTWCGEYHDMIFLKKKYKLRILSMTNRYQDWREQGIRDLGKARLDCQHEYWEWAGFTAQQSAEKVLKGLAMWLGLEVWGHSLTDLIKVLRKFLEVPEEILECAQTLDIFYIPSQYPNGFASGKPADYFNKKNAVEAIGAADDIIRFCESHLPK